MLFGLIQKSSLEGMQPLYDGLFLTRTLIECEIIGTHARIGVHQFFSNSAPPHPQRSKEIAYYFPVPDRSYVSAFVLTRTDGAETAARVYEVREAELDNAHSNEKFPILEPQCKNVLKLPIAATLAPGEDIEVKLEYVTELMEDERTGLWSLFIPSRLCRRYAINTNLFPAPGEEGMASPEDKDCKTELRVKFDLDGLVSVDSPSHPIAVSLENSEAIMSTDASSETDIVIRFKLANFNSPRCLAQVTTSPDGEPTTAMHLSFVPKFDIPPQTDNEIVIVVDCSASMQVAPMSSVRRALAVLLRSIPFDLTTTFNVFCFGSHCTSFWRSAVPYTEENMVEATRLIDAIDANMGGSELHAALETALDSCTESKNTSVFLLTDGQNYSSDEIIALVSKRVKMSSTRIFTLALGEVVSKSLCDGLARVGKGASVYANNSGCITEKLMHLLRIALIPIATDVKIDWGVQSPGLCSANNGFSFIKKGHESDNTSENTSELQSVNDALKLHNNGKNKTHHYSGNHATSSRSIERNANKNDIPGTTMLPSFTNCPINDTLTLTSESRFNAYAVFTTDVSISSQINLSATINNGSSLYEITLQTPIKVIGTEGTPSLARTTAHKLIENLEIEIDQSGSEHATMGIAHVTCLAKKYQLMSKFTSYALPFDGDLEDPAAEYLIRPSKTKNQLFYSGNVSNDSNAKSSHWSSPLAFQRQTLIGSTERKAFIDRFLGAARAAPPLKAPPRPRSQATFEKPTPFQQSEEILDALVRLQHVDGSFSKKVCMYADFYVPPQLLDGTPDSVRATMHALTFLETNVADIQKSWKLMYEKAKHHMEIIAPNLASNPLLQL